MFLDCFWQHPQKIPKIPQRQGAVQHICLSNLIFYVCKPGSADLVDAVRFGMDYVYTSVAFGRHSLDAAKRQSPLSPVPKAASLRQSLKAHKHWLTRDQKGLSPTSDIEGCFENGPGPFYPGRFHKHGFEASPYYSKDLEKAVLSSSAAGVASLLATGKIHVNAWDLHGETVLFKASSRGDPDILALLLLAAADPNVMARQARHTAKAKLLSLALGERMSLEEAYEVISKVSEPQRRQLCGRLGVFMPPEIASPVSEGPAEKVFFLVLRCHV